MDPVTVMLVLPKDDLWGAETLRSELNRAGIRLLPQSEFVGKSISGGAYKPQLILVQLTDRQELDVEVCQQLVKSHLAPVVAVSSEADEAYTLAIFNTGVDDLLVRPIRAQVLAARIRNILRRTQPALFKDLVGDESPAPVAAQAKSVLLPGFVDRNLANFSELYDRIRRVRSRKN